MSGSGDEDLFSDAPGNRADVSDHVCQYEPDSDGGRTPPAQVVIGGTRIPVINQGIRTEMRKDEAMSITRHSEVYFPRRWNGEQYGDAVQALNPNARNVYDRGDVYIRDHVSDTLVLAHRGFIMGAGSGAEGNIERRLTIGDPGQLLSAIPFGNEYEADATAAQVARDVIDELDAIVVPNVFESIEFRERLRAPGGEYVPALEFDDSARQQIEEAREEIDNTSTQDEIIDTFSDIFVNNTAADLLDVLGDASPSGVSAFTRALLNVGGDVATTLAGPPLIGVAYEYAVLKKLSRLSNFNLGSKKTFRRNEHTAADALAWVEQQVDGIFYFDAIENPRENGGIVLVYDEVITDDFEATHLDADDGSEVPGHVEVYKNNALSEIRPQNTLKTAGRPATDGNYAVATAVHAPLVERANMPLAPPVKNVDVVNPATVSRKAKQMLRENLQGESLGQITTAPAPVLTPSSVLTALPACGPNTVPGPPVEYEVESLVHHISAKRPARGNRRKHETELRVSLPVRLEDIEIVQVAVHQVQNPPSSSGRSWIDRVPITFPNNPFF